jgi:hypothetical protein
MAELSEALIDQDAAWARRFENTARSLPQRARYRQAIQAGEAMQADRDAVAQEHLLQTDKGARDLMFGRARIRQTERGMEQRQQNFEATQDRLRDNDLFRQDLEAQKLRASEAKELLDKQNAIKLASQTADALERMRSLYGGPARRGSPEFAKSALGILAENPDIDRGLRSQLLGDADIDEEDASVDEFLATLPADVGKRDELLKRMTVGRSATGKRTFSVAPPKAAQDNPDELFREFRQAETDRAALFDEKTGKLKPGVDADTVEIFTSRRNALRDRIRGAGNQPKQQETSTATPPPAPKESGTLVIADVIKSGGRALRDPSSGETVFVDKDNNILGRLKPDGGK